MILSGTQIAQSLREEMREQIAAMVDSGRRAPCLAIVLVGENAASEKYVGNKLKAAEKTGMTARLVRLPQSVEQEELISRIAELNEDSGVDGIIVQLPLPEHMDAEDVISAIAAHKDADGLHPLNEARLWRGQKGIRPCRS